MLLLLAGCDLLAPTPDPLALSVGLPAAQHAGSVAARDFLHLKHAVELSDDEHEALCTWMRGEAADDRIAEKLQARGDLGFALLEASGSDIRIGGEVVMSLTGGVIPEGARKGVMVSALYEDLLDDNETRKSTAERCGIAAPEHQGLPILIAIDPGLPFETVRQLLYTAGQAQVGAFYMMADGPAGAPLSVAEPDEEDLQLTTIIQQDGSLEFSRITRPNVETLPTTLAEAIPALLGDGSLGCSLVVPHLETRWSAVVSQFDALSAVGATRFILAGGMEEDTGQVAKAPAPPTDLALSLETTVSAFLMELPSIRPADMDPHGGSECVVLYAMEETQITPTEGLFSDSNLGTLGGLEASSLAELIGSGSLGSKGTPPGGLGTPPPNTNVVPNSAALSFGAHTIDGPLRPEVLTKALRRYENQLKYCYQRELIKDPTLTGGVTIRFVIDSDGSVSSSEVSQTTLNEATTQCVKGRFPRFSFPKLPGNLTATVTLPMTFTAN